MNNAYKELTGELESSDLEEIAVEVKTVIEKTTTAGGCGATPGKAHGGDLNGGDCLDVLILYERLFWLSFPTPGPESNPGLTTFPV